MKAIGHAGGAVSPPPASPSSIDGPAANGTQRMGTGDAAPPGPAILPNTLPEPVPQVAPEDNVPEASYDTYADIVALAGQEREMVLKAHLEHDVHVVEFEPGRIEFRPTETAPPDLAGRLISFLNGQTNRRWVVTVSQETGGPTIAENRAAAQRDLENEAAGHPLVKSVLENFPGAKLTTVTPVDEGDGDKD